MQNRILMACFLLIVPVFIQAQNVKVVSDLRSRMAFGAEKEIFKNFDVFGELELGLEHNLEEIGKIHGELGVVYSPLSFLSIEVKYRHTKNRKNYSDEFKYTHTYAIAAETDKKIDRFKLYYRLQYQNVDDEINWFNGDDKTRNLFRNRVKVKYNIKGIKIAPYLSTELYSPLSSIRLSSTKLKTIAGIEYRLKKVGELKLFYRNDRELTSYMPYTYHTLGASIVFKF